MQKRLHRRNRRRIRTYRWFNRFLQLTLGSFLTLRYNLRSENVRLLRRLKPPYLLLSNHMSFWDPFFLSNFVPDPVYYVTSDANFRSRILNMLLGLVGAIPKTKVLSDFDAVRNILRIKRSKGVIGIFPEGRRSWDGATLPIVYSTAKLIKLLKTPVVIARLHGAFLSLPRWTKKHRRGEIRVVFSLGFDSKQIGTMGVDEIYSRLVTLMQYDELEWQRGHNMPYRGRARAERLEQLLYVCPECRAIGRLHSRRHRLRCLSCGHEIRYEEDGTVTTVAGARHFETVRAWNRWQSSELIRILRAAAGKHPPGATEVDTDELIVRKGHMRLSTGYRAEPLRRHPKGNLLLFSNRLEYHVPGDPPLRFFLSTIKGANVQNNDRFEFYYEHTLYSFQSSTQRGCGYLWLNSVVILRALEQGRGDGLATIDDIHNLHYAAHSNGRPARKEGVRQSGPSNEVLHDDGTSG